MVDEAVDNGDFYYVAEVITKYFNPSSFLANGTQSSYRTSTYIEGNIRSSSTREFVNFYAVKQTNDVFAHFFSPSEKLTIQTYEFEYSIPVTQKRQSNLLWYQSVALMQGSDVAHV